MQSQNPEMAVKNGGATKHESQAPDYDFLADARLSEAQAFGCTELFHLCELSQTSQLVYGLAMYLTNGGERQLFAKVSSMASYFMRKPEEVQKAIDELCENGWLEPDVDGQSSDRYAVLSHSRWAKKYPRQCCVRKTKTP